jgi:AcrR family transcriptional regulator
MARRAGAHSGAEVARRARIIDALVGIVDDVGFEAASVTGICARAKVSRDTFYTVFESRQDCFLAMMDDAFVRVSELIERSFSAHEHWLEGGRAALAELLAFFEAEPRYARVWLIETLGAGAWALERRERHLTALTAAIVERWPPPEGAAAHPFAAEAVMSSLLGIIQRHLMSGQPEPLISLLGPLVGVACAPYTDRRVVREQVNRCQSLVPRTTAHDARPREPDVAAVELPSSLRHPRAHRLRHCLVYVAAHPCASNREIAAAIGVASRTQASTLLARLSNMGLLDKQPGLPGHPNAWSVSEHGGQVARRLERELTVKPIDKCRSHTIPTVAAVCVTS